MKIAITGHSMGIGKSFANYLQNKGHTIVGISKRDGNNIRNIPKIAEMIDGCDMWINNAQSGYAQTELLYSVWQRWQGQDKMIWLISTMMTRQPRVPEIPGLNQNQIFEYKNQKRALEDAFLELKNTQSRPHLLLIRPGTVATQARNTAGVDSADVDVWVKEVCEFYQRCQQQNLWPEEISLGFRKNTLAI